VFLLDLLCGARPFVAEGRRHADVDHQQVGTVADDLCQEVLGVAHRCHHLVPGVLEEPSEPFAQQGLVLGDQDSHGSSATIVVPFPSMLSSRNVPPWASTRSESPRNPEPRDGAAPPSELHQTPPH
jgi:hypothetical protein